jgi:hypothetical protein
MLNVVLPNVIMLNVIMPNVIMLNVVMPNVIMPIVIMLNVIMPNVVMLNVVSSLRQIVAGSWRISPDFSNKLFLAMVSTVTNRLSSPPTRTRQIS